MENCYFTNESITLLMDSGMSSTETIPEVSSEEENSQTSSQHVVLNEKATKENKYKKHVLTGLLVILVTVVIIIIVPFVQSTDGKVGVSYTGQYNIENTYNAYNFILLGSYLILSISSAVFVLF